MTTTASLEERRLLHTRRINCVAYERNDGLLDLEGTLIDTKPGEITLPERGQVRPGEPIHQMIIRLTIGRDLLIHDVAARTLQSPYAVCSTINDSYSKLVGMKIGPGFIQSARQLFRGRSGCSHLTELLPAMATTAFQVLWGEPTRALEEVLLTGSNINLPFDGCHALRSDGEIVRKHFPDFHQASAQ